MVREKPAASAFPGIKEGERKGWGRVFPSPLLKSIKIGWGAEAPPHSLEVRLLIKVEEYLAPLLRRYRFLGFHGIRIFFEEQGLRVTGRGDLQGGGFIGVTGH